MTNLSLCGALAALVLVSVGCTSIASVFAPPPPPKVPAPPPPPPVRPEPVAPPPVKKEPVTPLPAKKEPEPLLPATPELETPPKAPAPPAKVPTPAPPPVKKEPVTPLPAKKEPEPPPPSKPGPEAPPKKDMEAPPPVLAPQVGKQGEEHLRRTTLSRMQRSEQIIGQLDAQKLTGEQREQLLTVQSLLGSAREALSSQDLTKASNLAEKARILAEELAQTVR